MHGRRDGLAEEEGGVWGAREDWVSHSSLCFMSQRIVLSAAARRLHGNGGLSEAKSEGRSEC